MSKKAIAVKFLANLTLVALGVVTSSFIFNVSTWTTVGTTVVMYLIAVVNNLANAAADGRLTTKEVADAVEGG